MNKLSKRLGAVGLAAALAFTFMPATALAAAGRETPTLGKISNNEAKGLYTFETLTGNVGDPEYEPEYADKTVQVTFKNVKKLYVSNVGYLDGDKGNSTDFRIVAAFKDGKKVHYIPVENNGDLELVDGDYELDLLGNTWAHDIEVRKDASLKITDSKKYKKLTAKGDYDTNAPDGFAYKPKRKKEDPKNSTFEITPTTYKYGVKANGWGYDDTKLYGGWSLPTIPTTGTIATVDGKQTFTGKLTHGVLADKDQGYAFYVGTFGATSNITLGTVGTSDADKSTAGKLTLNAGGYTINNVTIENGTFTQNAGTVKHIESNADSDSTKQNYERTTAKITINATGDAEDISGIAGNGDSLKKGETVKIKAGTFTGDNPAKLGEEDANAIGATAMIGGFVGDPQVPTFKVDPGTVDGEDHIGWYALNGAVTVKAQPYTDIRIATNRNKFDTETAMPDTTLKAKADNRVSYAVITNKINYTDMVGDKESKKVSYDTRVIADSGYVQDKEFDSYVGTYVYDEEHSQKIWDDGDDATQPKPKFLNSFDDPGEKIGTELNNLESVEADDVAGNAGIVKDDFTYERTIELNAYPKDEFSSLTGLDDNELDTAAGITYFTSDPSAYTEDGHGVAVIDGNKWIISSYASNFDKTSELAAVSKKAEKSIEIKRVDGHMNDEGKIDNSSAGVAFELDYTKADTLKIAAPSDVVVASTLDVTNGREKADNFYTVYVYGLDASLGAASDFGVDTNPTNLQDITFTVRQLPAKTSIVVTDIAKGVDVETATGIEYYAIYDSKDAEEADYYFGATEDVIKELTADIAGDTAEVKAGVVYVSDGIEGSFVKVAEDVDITADDPSRFNKVANATAGFNDWNVTANVAVYRLYNKNNGEHLFITKTNQAEVDFLVAQGWENDGIKWKAPKTSELPVYRAYNPNSGLHYYTANKGEYDILVSMGWSADQGISFYSAAATASPIYCEYNVNDGTHNYTADKPEHDYLLSIGWTENAVTFYGVK